MLHLVHDCTTTLIGGVGTHINPRLVGIIAVGSWSARTIAHTKMFLDAHEVAEDAASLGKSVVDAFVGGIIASVVVRASNISLRDGIELYGLSITGHTVFVGGIGTHVIFRRGLQILEIIDCAIIRYRLGTDDIIDGRVRILCYT